MEDEKGHGLNLSQILASHRGFSDMDVGVQQGFNRFTIPFYFFLSKCSHKENTADWLTPHHTLLERPGFHTTLSLFSLNGIHRKATKAGNKHNYCVRMYHLNKGCV